MQLADAPNSIEFSPQSITTEHYTLDSSSSSSSSSNRKRVTCPEDGSRECDGVVIADDQPDEDGVEDVVDDAATEEGEGGEGGGTAAPASSALTSIEPARARDRLSNASTNACDSAISSLDITDSRRSQYGGGGGRCCAAGTVDSGRREHSTTWCCAS